jgi:MFS family permease
MPREPLFTLPFFRLWAFAFFAFGTAFQLFPAIPFRIVELGGTKAQAGFFLAIYTYACAFSAPITGTIADHIGRRRMLILGASAFIIASALYGVVTNFVLLLIVAACHGIFWSSLLASAAAMISEIIPQSRRTEGLAWWGLASTAAIAVAPLVGLVMYQRYGWMALCLEMIVVSLVMVWLGTGVRAGREKSDAPFPKWREVVDWRVIGVAMSLFVISFGYGGITSYVAMMSVRYEIEPPSLFFSVFAVTIIVTRVFGARLGDRIGPKALLYPSLAMVPIALAILAWTTSGWQLVTAAIFYGIGFGAAYPAFMTFVLGHTEARRRGATFGSVLWAFDTGIGTGSLVTGVLIQYAGYPIAFGVAAAIAALAIPIFQVASRLLSHGSGTAATLESATAERTSM